MPRQAMMLCWVLLLGVGGAWHQHHQVRRRWPSVRFAAATSSAVDEEVLWSKLDAATSRTEADLALEKLQASGFVRLFRSAKLQPQYKVSLSQLETTTRARDVADAFGVYGGQQVEKLATLMGGIVASAAVSALAAQVSLTFVPDIVRFVVVQGFCFAPFGALLLGIALPEEFQRALTAAYATYLPAYRARLARHEAGHVVAGYVLGLPPASISVNPAAAAVAFHDLREEQRRALGAAGRDARYVASNAPVEALAIVSLAGIMSEVEEFGDAEGGAADLLQLQAIFDSTNLASEDQLELARWAALQAHLILKRNAAALEALVAYFLNTTTPQDTSSVAACLRAIESAPIDQNDEEKVAALRKQNRVEPGPLESFFVKRPRPLDWDAPVDYYGRSPQQQQQQQQQLFSLSPEDVPLLAFLVTTTFLIWALTGGITTVQPH